MSDTTHPTLDAAALEVLRDVARQEDSVLLRVPVARGRGIDLWLGRDPISAGAPFLSSAERHLLEVHRDEVAAWMRLAAFQGLFEDPKKAGLMARELDAKRLIELPGQAAVAHRATDILRAADPRYLPFETQPILRRASAWPNPRPQDPWALAALSRRLVPHPAPQQWFAFRALEAGHLRSVRTVLRERSAACASKVAGSLAGRAELELHGALAAAECRWEDAARHYRLAALGVGGGCLTACWWAWNEAQAGRVHEFREAMDHWQSLESWTDDLGLAAGKALAAARTAHNWKPTDSAVRLVAHSEGPRADWMRSCLR